MRRAQQAIYISGMPEPLSLIICLPGAKAENSSSALKIRTGRRDIEGGEQSQLNYLKWLGIDWDESVDVGGEYGPYRQSERNDIYKTYYEELLEKGLAYKCYFTEEELSRARGTGCPRRNAALLRQVPQFN
jgi:hypothetical protein